MNEEMNEQVISYKKRAKFYWIIWIFIVESLFLVRLLVINIEVFYMIGFYMVSAWFSSWVLYFIEIDRLMEYLKKSHNNKWYGFLNTLPYVRSKYKGFKLLIFIWSSENLNDNKLTLLKKECRFTGLLPISVFITLPFIFILLSKM